MITDKLKLGLNSQVIEIASNDGYLLQYFKERGIPVLGVEPAQNVAKAAIAAQVPTLTEFFGRTTARKMAADSQMADLLIGNNEQGEAQLLKSIETIYRRPDDKIIEPEESELADMGHMLLTTNLGPLDILSFIEERKTYEDLIDHTVEIPFRGQMLRVLDLKMIVDLKRLSNDPGDKQRLAILEETLRQSGRFK